MLFRPSSSTPALFILFAMAGCSTELKVHRYFDPVNIPTAGAPYALSFTQYEIAVTRRLVACSSAGDPTDPDPVKQQPKPIDLKVAIKADIKSTEARDPMRNYVIDLESLNSFFKTTSATVAYYDNGAIKSLNASAEDKGGEFIASIAGTFGKLVSAGVSSAGILALTVAPPSGCSTITKTNLAKLDKLETEIEQSNEKIKFLTDELSKLNALLLASKELSSKATREKLGQLQVQLMDEMAKSRAAAKATEPLLKGLTEKQTFNWPNDGETFSTSAGNPAMPNLDRKLYDSWLNPSPKKVYTETAGDMALYQQLATASAIHLKLQAAEPLGRTQGCAKDCPDDKLEGFKYRIPAEGQLLVCADTICSEETLHKASDIAQISQLGHVYVLPLKSTMFSTKSISATFAENGRPTSIGVAATAASDKAASTIAAIGDLATTLHKTRSEKELNDLKAKTEILKAQKDYADATAALHPSPSQDKQDATNAFKIDTDLFNANLAYLNAQKALDEAKKAQLVSTP